MPASQVTEAVVAGQCFSTMPFDPLVDSYYHPSSDDPKLRSVEDMDQLSTLFVRLTERERKVVLLRYYLGWTQAEIGTELKLSQMQISRTLRSAMTKLAAERRPEGETPDPENDAAPAVESAAPGIRPMLRHTA